MRRENLTPRHHWAVVAAGVALASCTTTPASQPRIETLTLASKDAQLAATLHLPSGNGPFPAAVLMHGSGRITGAQMAQQRRTAAFDGFRGPLVRQARRGRIHGEIHQHRSGQQRTDVRPACRGRACGCRGLIPRRDIDGKRIGLFGEPGG